MPPAARVGDMHVCPMFTGLVPHVGGPILPPGCLTVLIGSMPAARVTDLALCAGPPDMIALGSPTVMIGGMMAARIGDLTAHGGAIVQGLPTVMIGIPGMGAPVTVLPGAPGVGAAGLSPAAFTDSESPGDALAEALAQGAASVAAATESLVAAAKSAAALIEVGGGCGCLSSAATAAAKVPQGQPPLSSPAANPPYDPTRWNKPKVKNSTNCYAYAANDPDGHPPGKPQPGEHSGNRAKDVDCASVSAAAKSDGMVPAPSPPVNKPGFYLVALVSAPGEDYHWYRQDDSGLWSQKHGNGPATNLDESGHVITDPQTCNRDGSGAGMPNYSDFCGYFYVPAGGIRTGAP